jgi:hypothetical protein
MADDFISPVPFDSLGTGIPADNSSLRVQREDCIVVDFVEQHPIFRFATSKRLLGNSAPGNIAPDGRTYGRGNQYAKNGSEVQDGLRVLLDGVIDRQAANNGVALF